MHRKGKIRVSMNLKPTYVFNSFATESRAIVGHGVNTRTQSRESAERAVHPPLFSPSVGEWRVFVFIEGRLHIDRIVCLSKHSRLDCEKTTLKSKWHRCSINRLLLVSLF
ncbi:hypothetical protein TNCV_2424131 [Trichonephila clavipes]|nr:hypothetical protein TNCV_2424131 [Trichonephila clavipes]